MEKINNILKNIKLKPLHITIIIVGSIFISLSIFHTNMWFDESYSIGMAEKSFSQIWKIGANDVHPILYYFCLHVLNLIFGSNIIMYRILSSIAIILIGIIGYTHIRKDFGEKTGILFSFLTLFLPVSALYAGEIRMYSLGWLLGTIMAIYAYRIYKNKIGKFTYVFFGLSSLTLAYTHYYGLMFAGIINLLLFIYLIKTRNTRKQDLKKFLITAIIQVIAYIPWLIAFVMQLKGVSGGFWITLSFPGTIYDILTIQYKGNLVVSPIMLTTAFYAYIIYLISQTKKEERKPGTWGFIAYISVIIIALLISLGLHTVILLSRYLLVVTGLLIFGISYFMAKDKNYIRVTVICLVILVMSCCSNAINIKQSYSKGNRDFINYLNEEIQKDDIIVYSNAINGAVITTEISQIKENTSYFYNKEKWGVQESYKAFNMQIKDTLEEILENYSGRIWLVESGNMHELLEEISEKYQITQIEEKQFVNKYRDYSYTIELIEKY